jgi:response regulator NasT
MPTVVDTNLTILVIDENPVRTAILEDGLREAGYLNIVRLNSTHELLRRVFSIDPDVILIDLANPSRDVLEQMFQVSRTVKRPIAMFVDRSDTAMIEASVDAGVSAYIVDGLRKERVKPILDMTVSRFNAFDRLARELEQARSELAERKVIERAKGILMKSRGISEEDAFAMLRKTAMNEKKKLAEIAQSVVTAAQLLG